ncbi:DNA replication origin-binding helicase [Spheniscid alphaherpesvirus 1]|uniref:Replication origin-binding protein n=1 Tax=Spheniscid alphaherpesvirus 1 TaxID=2560777 RepID=A0A1R3T218_9ALPH|nr:DNA replication origin-binding helicase [Spheniscid alphaherpesvirus 1]
MNILQTTARQNTCTSHNLQCTQSTFLSETARDAADIFSASRGRNYVDYYASSVSLSKMLYGGYLSEWIASRKPGVQIEHQCNGPVNFTKPYDDRSRRVTIVRAPMGSGKTTALIEWLKVELRSTDKSALVVSCRRSFTQTLARRFNEAGLEGFVTYFTSTDYIMRGQSFRRLLVQIESLHRVEKTLVDSYDVLVLDEVMSTLGQLYSPTMTHLTKVDTLMARLLRNCPKIIAMDATVNAQLVELFTDMRGQENVHVIIGEYSAPGFSDRSCTVLRKLGTDTLKSTMVPPVEPSSIYTESQNERICHNFGSNKKTADSHNPDTFFAELGRRLAGGLNICIFSSTVTFSETVATFCSTFTESVLVLNSLRPQADVSEWGNYRVVIYTTVVTVGLSFDDIHFHSMFAYVKPMLHGPDMVSVYQSLGRVRRLLLNELVLYVDGSGARSEPIFTPMLLNHIVDDNGGWPTKFSQVTNLLCCRFRDRCAASFRDNVSETLSIYPKLKYKHFFERCTLNSLGDSLNIIHTLLEANRIRVSFSGCGSKPDSGPFCDFLADLRSDSLASQKELRAIKSSCVIVSAEAEVADSEDVATFSEKYLIPDSTPTDVANLLRAINNPIAREHFVNTVMLEACRRVPAALQSEAVFRRLYDYYASGVLPTICNEDGVTKTVLVPDLNVAARWELYRLCAKIADSIGWDPAIGGSTSDISSDAILGILEPDYDRYIQLLMEIPRCNVSESNILSESPAREVQAALCGWRRRVKPITKESHSVSLFRVLWLELFGGHLYKSTQTFPGSTKVKNLRKEEIISILDSAKIDRSSCRTHKQLYSLLMSNRKAFANGSRYKIRAPKWSRILKTSSSVTENQLYEQNLEEALSEVPPSAWPVTSGFLSFANL